MNKLLIVSENIKCQAVDYAFNSKLPREIINLTINKELIPYLKKMKKEEILQYLHNVQYNYITSVDKELPKKIKNYIGKSTVAERLKLIKQLEDEGFTGDEKTWDMYTLEELKLELKQMKKK